MNDLYTIIIPCHNDCDHAETIAKDLDNVIIGHNGCKDRKSFDWANKAKTINHIAKTVDTEYIIVLDADTEISDFALLAFEREMKKDVNFGSGTQVFMRKGKVWSTSFKSRFNGAFWFVRTDLLRLYPVPENVVVEDTAYNIVMKRLGIKSKLVVDAIVYVELFKNSIIGSMKQQIRYQLGAMQLSRINYYWYLIFIISISIIPGIALLYMLFITFDASMIDSNSASTGIPVTFLFIISILVIFCSMMMFYFISRKYFLKFINNFYVKILFLTNIAPLFTPFISLYLFIRKKSIW